MRNKSLTKENKPGFSHVTDFRHIFIQNLVDIFIFRHILIVNFKQLKWQKLFKISVAIQN